MKSLLCIVTFLTTFWFLGKDRRTFRILPTRSSPSNLYQAVLRRQALGLHLDRFSEPMHHFNQLLYRLWPATLDVVQFVSASPGLPMRNGIFKVCHGPEPPFLRILPARLFFRLVKNPRPIFVFLFWIFLGISLPSIFRGTYGFSTSQILCFFQPDSDFWTLNFVFSF